LDTVSAALRESRPGIRFLPDHAERGLRSQVGGAVELDLDAVVDRKLKRFMSDAAAYSYMSLRDAIADAGLDEAAVSHPRTGLIAGSGGGSSRMAGRTADLLRERGVRKVGPYMVPRTMCSTVSANLATAFKIKGLSYSMSAACATSAHCIGAAADLIRHGAQDIMFAGGGEDLHWTMSVMFDAMGALSTSFNDTPARLAPLRRQPRRLRHRRRRRHAGAGGLRTREGARRAHPCRAARLRRDQRRRRHGGAQPAKARCAACAWRWPASTARSTTSTPTAPRRRSATSPN
jgi:3-oxoacyl-(acyl-carrier-protein) synthase